MPTRNVVLTTAQAEWIRSLVDSGRYQNASEVIREGLRLLEQRDAEDAARLAALRAAASTGIDHIDNGAYTEVATPEALQAHLSRLTRRSATRS